MLSFHFFILNFFIICLSLPSLATGVKAKDIVAYTKWKQTHDNQARGCEAESMPLQKQQSTVGTMMGSQMRDLKYLHIPTALLHRKKLNSNLLAKYEAIERVAKSKGEAAISSTPKGKTYSKERIEKTNGFDLAYDANLVPENFLKNFDYKKSCECLHSTQNIAANEEEYNQLSVVDFQVRESENKLKCFVDNAIL